MSSSVYIDVYLKREWTENKGNRMCGLKSRMILCSIVVLLVCTLKGPLKKSERRKIWKRKRKRNATADGGSRSEGGHTNTDSNKFFTNHHPCSRS